MKQNISIWNYDFMINCDEDEVKSVIQAQDILNNAIQKIKKDISIQNRERIILMAALMSVQTLLAKGTDNNEDYSKLMLKLEDVLK
jgi:cell division protein ZapA (FtsZ GTPase activity inhibitor)